MYEDVILKCIHEISDDEEKNFLVIKKYFSNYNISIDDIYSEICKWIKEEMLIYERYATPLLISLINNGVDFYRPGLYEDSVLFDTLCLGFKLENFKKILNAFIKNGLDINKRFKSQNKSYSILEYLMLSDNYKEDISEIYMLLIECGYKTTLKDTFFDEYFKKQDYSSSNYIQSMKDKVKAIYDREIRKNSINIDEKIINSDLTTKIKYAIDNVNSDIEVNSLLINQLFGDINNKYGVNNNSLIQRILLEENLNESNLLELIETILYCGVDANYINSDCNCMITTALHSSYSEKFILELISIAVLYGYDINNKHNNNTTILHSAMLCPRCIDILKFYDYLIVLGYDSTILYQDNDKYDYNLEDCLLYASLCNQNHVGEKWYDEKYSKTVFAKFEEKYHGIVEKNDNKKIKDNGLDDIEINDPPIEKINLSEKNLEIIEKYGKILNYNNYISDPAIGRENELRKVEVALASMKKMPILVGNAGVGKTAIVDSLVYNINNNNVPKFLKDQIILEINANSLVAGTSYRGEFEEKLEELFKECSEKNIILFIDEIHTIYGAGVCKDESNDMASVLKKYIDKNNLKVIGATTDYEYNKFFSKDALKRRFLRIDVKEPKEDLLKIIIPKVIDDYSVLYGINKTKNVQKKEFIHLLIESTKINHRVYDDRVNNPDLVISIIDIAYAYAKFEDSDEINIGHFIKSFEDCDRLYDASKEDAIMKLNKLNQCNKNIENQKCKIIKFPCLK
ncbi:MAG: AAA family ATPase [bacterium]|nr:AAA family ATPase [bacterium]